MASIIILMLIQTISGAETPGRAFHLRLLMVCVITILLEIARHLRRLINVMINVFHCSFNSKQLLSLLL